MKTSEIIMIIEAFIMLMSGLIILVLYKLQKSDELKARARLIILEIQSMEKEMEKYKRISISSEEIFQTTPVYNSIEWFNAKHLLSTKLSNEDIVAIDSFYKYIIEFEDARNNFKQSVVINRTSKITAIQNELANICREYAEKHISITDRSNKSEIYIQTKDMLNIMERFNVGYDIYSSEFQANTFSIFYTRIINLYKPITNTPAYNSLKIIARKAR